MDGLQAKDNIVAEKVCTHMARMVKLHSNKSILCRSNCFAKVVSSNVFHRREASSGLEGNYNKKDI